MGKATKDSNRVHSLLGGSSADSGETPIAVYADPTTHRLYVDAVATVSDLASALSDGDAINVANVGTMVLGTDGSNYQVLSVDSSGKLNAVVTATNLDIRDLTSVSDSVEVKQATGTNLHAVIDSGTITNITNAITVNSHAVTVASGGIASGAVASGAIVVGAVVDGAIVTLGAKADAKSTATDTTAISVMQVLKEISYMEQNPASRAVTNAGTFVVQINGDALTALQLIDNLATAVDGNYINVNTNIAGTDVAGGNGTVNAQTLRVTLASDSTGQVKLAASDGVDIGNVDVASIAVGTNHIGKIIPQEYELAGNTTHVKKYYTNAGAVTDGIIWSPASGKRWYVTDIYLQTSADATVTIEDDLAAGDSAIWKAELKAGSGWSHSFTTPWFSGEDEADLIVTTTAGNIYITVTGYEI